VYLSDADGLALRTVPKLLDLVRAALARSTDGSLR
jgi:hypothetical protein